HRQHLRLARELKIEQVAERERDALSDRQQAVVAQDHHGVVAEVLDQPRPLVDVDREPLVVVIAHAPVEQLRVLAYISGKSPSFMAATATPALEWVWMTQSTSQ